MPRRHLTAPTIDRIKKPAIGQVDHFDKGYPGLALRVSYGGSRSWVYFYRWGGKQKRLTLGQWPTLNLTGARDAWRAARESLSKGLEPTAQVLSPMGTPAVSGTATFKAVLADWLKRDQAANRSHDEVKRILEKEALPGWGEVPLGAIGRRQVLELTDTIADRGAVTLARRCHAHLHRMFRWSVGRGIIEGNPVTDLPKPGAEVKRKRVLSDEELALAWKAAEKIGWPMGQISQLLILTLARRDEIGELRWSEIDVEHNEIRLEGPRTKNGEPHIIPLSRASRKLIDTLPRVADSPLVFTTTGTTPVSGWSRAKRRLDRLMITGAKDIALKRGDNPASVSLVPWRIHDLRRTGATGLERLGIRLQVVEALLGHITGSRAGVVGIYQLHNYEEEKREAVEKWSRHLASLLRGRQ